MPPDEATRGEIARRLEELAEGQKDFRSEVLTELKELRQELPRDYMRKDVLDALLRPIYDRVGALESTNTWITRTVGGLVIAAVLALVLTFGGGR